MAFKVIKSGEAMLFLYEYTDRKFIKKNGLWLLLAFALGVLAMDYYNFKKAKDKGYKIGLLSNCEMPAVDFLFFSEYPH